MSAQRALRLVRPLLTQPRRPCTTCNDRGALPPCPPCESAPPPPPCRTDKKSALTGQRVVCCAPPQGKRPPCPDPVPDCDKTCEHQIPVPEPLKQAPVNLCGAARDAVAQRFRDFEEFHRQRFEREAAERKARRAMPVRKEKHSHKASTYAVATDGQAYAVIKDAPAPRCCAAPTSTHCSAPHPPPTQITLEPIGDCRPKKRQIMDPCQNQPRTILTIDRSANEIQESTKLESTKHESTRSESPKPVQENPKSHSEKVDTASPPATPCERKGLTTRIMETLKGGSSKRPPPPPSWCNRPKLASPPPKCRPPTMADRIRRKSPTPKRHFHTSTFESSAKSAAKPAGCDAVLAASKKLSAALSERESLKEAGRGRSVRPPSCAPKPAPPPPPPPPRPSGGAMEFSIPPGADTVCVRVSMGKATVAPPRGAAGAAGASACPPPVCTPRPPLSSASDSWLSIKKLQKKISSCGRSEPAPPAPAPAPARPAPPSPCPPQGKAKMTDVLPHTVFIR